MHDVQSQLPTVHDDWCLLLVGERRPKPSKVVSEWVVLITPRAQGGGGISSLVTAAVVVGT